MTAFGVVSLLGGGLARWRAALKTFEAARSAIDRAVKARMEPYQVELSKRRVEELAAQEQALAAEATLRSSSERLAIASGEFHGTSGTGRFVRFVQGRATDGHYAAHQGLVSTVRKDFEELSRGLAVSQSSDESEWQAVLVFIECDDLLGWAAVAADDDLYDSLQAGHGASSSRALFDCTKACVQSMVRDLQEGRGPKPNPSVLTLPVLDCWEDVQAPDPDFSDALRGMSRKPFRTHLTAPGAVGRLPTIVNYIPPGLDDAGKAWLKLEVPAEMWADLNGESPNVSVTLLSQEGAAERFIGITMAEGPHLLVAYIDASDSRVATALSEFVKAAQCSVALEDQASGRILTVKARWPAECGPVRSHVGSAPSADGLPRSSREEFERRATQVSKEEGGQIALYVCEVVDARRWQQHDCDVSSHAIGARGGLVNVDAGAELQTFPSVVSSKFVELFPVVGVHRVPWRTRRGSDEWTTQGTPGADRDRT